MTSDLLIREARIIDATGAPWFVGDVRIGGGRITAIGPSLKAEGADVLDAERSGHCGRMSRPFAMPYWNPGAMGRRKGRSIN